ncbi:MAG: hypothetical protein AAGB19_13345 [Cyanobacteria bacterium P01_F01_bin.3]
MRLSPLFFSLLTVLSIGTAGTLAKAQTTPPEPIITPLESSPMEVTGQTGGNDRSACGNINRSRGQTIRITEPFASLSFEVKSQGDYTLLITGANGFRECVFAHNYDGGVIQAPGLLDQGVYRVFVGDRSGESHPYTLSITQ